MNLNVKCSFFFSLSPSIQTYHLEQATVRCMRGLLLSMMRQSDRLERFKNTSDPKDSIHAKFGVKTGLQVVGDEEWGHLQIDAISLYLLFLAQVIAKKKSLKKSRI
jgi:phosphorylase kinase alpha/beta subunit